LKSISLLALRITIALLVLHWGIDKLVDPEHALRVSDNFYRGLLSHGALMPVLGTLQVGLALLAMVGLFRRIVDPLVLLVNLGSMLAVWRSVVDPWGWFLEGTNALFFPSVIVVAGCLVLIAFRDQETLVLDRRRTRLPG
jgi:putative oxidoreductase